MDFTMVNTLGDNPNELASFTSYPDAGYNHSGWLSDDGTIYAMQDENHGYDIKILDVSDFTNISVLSTFNSGVDVNSMAHNGIIKDNLLYVAYYHDGLRVFDISDPFNPNEVNSYDTYAPNNHASYKGAWGVYPYLNSGNILVSDMQSGLYVIELNTNSTNVKQELDNTIIYPNPISSAFKIYHPAATEIKIYDIAGRMIFTKKIDTNSNTIYRNGITNGLYIYKLYNNDMLIKSDKIIFK